MQDLSANSAEWWENILLSAESYYSEYLKLDPVARLSHKPQPNEVLRQARWRRVEKHAETLVLAGLPKTVRSSEIDRVSCDMVSGNGDLSAQVPP